MERVPEGCVTKGKVWVEVGMESAVEESGVSESCQAKIEN